MKPIEIIHDGTKFTLRSAYEKVSWDKENRDLKHWLQTHCHYEYGTYSIPMYLGWSDDDVGYVAFMTDELATRLNQYGIRPDDNNYYFKSDPLGAMALLGEPVMIIWCSDCNTVIGIVKMSHITSALKGHLSLLEVARMGVLE